MEDPTGINQGYIENLSKVEIDCSNCQTKYFIKWDRDQSEMKPFTCPFCGYEIDEEDQHDDQDDDNRD
jgi:peptide subunit release factor 1 (eRF1)|tara:strand:+ start:73 stop:276 length:204 start_codon:yes stop_codon:yes gene_type:complete